MIFDLHMIPFFPIHHSAASPCKMLKMLHLYYKMQRLPQDPCFDQCGSLAVLQRNRPPRLRVVQGVANDSNILNFVTLFMCDVCMCNEDLKIFCAQKISTQDLATRRLDRVEVIGARLALRRCIKLKAESF